jgi:hypothetical protein
MVEGSCHCGAVHWRIAETPQIATACNCTVCRRYGTLWAYGFEGETIEVSGPTLTYSRGEKNLQFHFCETCGCVAYWSPIKPREDGRRRMGVNLRLAEPDAVAAIPVEHLDALDTWEPVERSGRCVADLWF